MMQLQWESDLDELVDTNYQMMLHVKEMNALRRRGLFASLAVAGIFTTVILMFTLPKIAPNPIGVILAFAVAGGLLAMTGVALTHTWTMKKRLRRLLRGRIRPGEPRTITLVLSSEGVMTKMPECQLAFGWSQIDEIDDTGDSVYFYARGGIAGIPTRAFESETMRTQFIAEAKGYLAKARTDKTGAVSS
jgi:hypothetical protein